MTTEERIEKLEKDLARLRSQHRWRWAWVFITLVGLVVFMELFEAGKVPRILEASEFVVIDGKGRERAKLGMSDDGCPRLGIYNSEGKPRAMLALIDPSAGLFLGDENGKFRVAIAMKENAPHLSIMDENDEIIWSAP
jgi:hypothetical protein